MGWVAGALDFDYGGVEERRRNHHAAKVEVSG